MCEIYDSLQLRNCVRICQVQPQQIQILIGYVASDYVSSCALLNANPMHYALKSLGMVMRKSGDKHGVNQNKLRGNKHFMSSEDGFDEQIRTLANVSISASVSVSRVCLCVMMICAGDYFQDENMGHIESRFKITRESHVVILLNGFCSHISKISIQTSIKNFNIDFQTDQEKKILGGGGG